MENEQMLEQKKLDEFLQVINENLKELREKKKEVDQENKELYDAYMEGDVELYSSLMVSSTMQDHVNHSITANESALEKTHFGRIDYLDQEKGEQYRLYIGKHGITKNATDIVIMDWRAAAASIYYEGTTGECSYRTPQGKMIPIRLDLKRTFDIDGPVLKGFYDSDTAANDELLIKYLAKNKDVVLGEIVATIQQEQNTIIRERPNRSMIIQGVAGSGKTTVAVHRISYILYNFSDRYDPSEICIIGSNDILLNYIASGLPSLDVYNTKQYRMEKLFEYLIGAYLPKKYEIIPTLVQESSELRLKSSLAFVQTIERWTRDEESRIIPTEEVRDKSYTFLSQESIDQYCRYFDDRSVVSKMENLNTRLAAAIKLEMDGEDANVRKEMLKKYKKHFSKNYKKRSLVQLYLDFLFSLEEHLANTTENANVTEDANENSTNTNIMSSTTWSEWKKRVKKGFFDCYDLAAMALLAHGWLDEGDDDEFAQMYIDEAQDYGVAVYYVIKKRMPKTAFMIMGDVSQNINYDSGMNDWEELRQIMLPDSKDPSNEGLRGRFYTLCKSYRNTIEISKFAAQILDRSSFKTYPIEPIVRHGSPVGIWKENDETAMTMRVQALIEQLKKEDYKTIALICRDEDEAARLKALTNCVSDTGNEAVDCTTDSVTDGAIADTSADIIAGITVTVLPLALTKGLEFDAVILYNPNEECYADSERDAKLLYVAVTRALHELHIVYTGELCKLLSDCPTQP